MIQDNFDAKRKEIQELGLNAIKDFFCVDFNNIDKDIIKSVHEKARIGMQFEREMSISRRAVEMNYIRVFKMVAEDKSELKRLIKKSLPQYLR